MCERERKRERERVRVRTYMCVFGEGHLFSALVQNASAYSKDRLAHSHQTSVGCFGGKWEKEEGKEERRGAPA